MPIEHDIRAYVEVSNGEYEKVPPPNLASGEHPFSNTSIMFKASPSVLDKEVERIRSLVSLKAKRGVDRCFGQERCQYLRDGHDTPEKYCARRPSTHSGWISLSSSCDLFLY